MSKFNFKLDMPFWAVITLILIAYTVGAVLYLITTFFHAWYTKGSFLEAVDVLGTNAVKAVKGIFLPFVLIGALFKSFVSAINELLIERPWRNLGEFFAWCAGADLEIFRRVNSSERKSKTAMGMVIFFTIATTSALAGNSWGNIFHSLPVGVGISCIWFVLFLSLDRTVLKWMDKNSGWKVAVARLVMILGIGYLNTLFVSMEMYHDEIMAQIQEDKMREIAGVSDSISTVTRAFQRERDQLQTNIDLANSNYLTWASGEQAKIDAQRAIWLGHQERIVEEVAGNVGSGKNGWGDAAKAAFSIAQIDSATLVAMMAKFDTENQNSPQYQAKVSAENVLKRRDPELLADITKNQDFLKGRSDLVTGRKQDGFGHRVDAMWTQAGKRPFTFFMTFMFFLMLESMPVLMKLMSTKGNYDFELALADKEFHAEQQYQRSIQLMTKQHDYEQTMEQKVNDHLQEQVRRKMTLNELRELVNQQTIVAFVILQKHLAEIEVKSQVLPEDQRKKTIEVFTAKAFEEFIRSTN
jgi:hypothetical protein